MADASPPLVARALQLAQAAQRATDAYDRRDLGDRLTRASERLRRPDLHALVIGEFKKGKSTLVNAILNARLCPVSDEVATVVPTIVRHGDEPAAEVVAQDDTTDTTATTAATPPVEPARWAIGLDEIPAWASERGNADNARGIRAVEIRVPRQLLRSGLALVDTPGVGGLQSVHGAATMAALGLAEVVIFVTDASQELSGVEVEVLRAAAARCPTVVCVLTKTDLYPAWRRIAELDQGHIAAAGLHDVRVLPVSSLLRQQALAANSKELNIESGYPALLTFLNESVVGRAQQVAVRTAVSDVTFVLDQLEATFSAERDVLVDPAGAQPVLDELERAKARAEQLRTRSARWQQTLGDGSQDLASEIDHDLRRRLRDVSLAAEEALDQHDPIDIWDDFSAWLRREAAATVADNAEVLRFSANALASRVAEHFALDEEALVHAVDIGEGPRVSGELDVELERTRAGNTALAAMRGSYGGILMFGMMGQLIGLSLMNPLTAVIGIGLGRKALKEEKKRQLLQRRQQAKMAVRRYLDEVSFAVNKDSRDAIRHVQRDLRNEFTERAEQLQRSTREALGAAEAAARQTVEQAGARLRQIETELGNLAKVRAAAQELMAACQPRAAAA
jgi:Dynamin family